MKKAELPFLADWFAISFRWFNLLGITIALTTAGSLIWPVTAGLIFAAIWNVIMSLLATINVRMPSHRLINLCVDILVSGMLYSMVGGLLGPLTWAGLLAILTAAIYYEWRGGLLAATFLSIIQFGLSYLTSFQNDPTPILIPMGVIFVFNLTAGIIFGLSSKRLMKGLRHKYFSEMRQRQGGEGVGHHLHFRRGWVWPLQYYKCIIAKRLKLMPLLVLLLPILLTLYE